MLLHFFDAKITILVFDNNLFILSRNKILFFSFWFVYIFEKIITKFVHKKCIVSHKRGKIMMAQVYYCTNSIYIRVQCYKVNSQQYTFMTIKLNGNKRWRVVDNFARLYWIIVFQKFKYSSHFEIFRRINGNWLQVLISPFHKVHTMLFK